VCQVEIRQGVPVREALSLAARGESLGGVLAKRFEQAQPRRPALTLRRQQRLVDER
jgi:hypothetical protein